MIHIRAMPRFRAIAGSSAGIIAWWNGTRSSGPGVGVRPAGFGGGGTRGMVWLVIDEWFTSEVFFGMWHATHESPMA